MTIFKRPDFMGYDEMKSQIFIFHLKFSLISLAKTVFQKMVALVQIYNFFFESFAPLIAIYLLFNHALTTGSIGRLQKRVYKRLMVLHLLIPLNSLLDLLILVMWSVFVYYSAIMHYLSFTDTYCMVKFDRICLLLKTSRIFGFLESKNIPK